MKKINLFVITFMLLILSGCNKNETIDLNKTNVVKFHDLTLEIPTAFIVDKANGDEYIQFYSFEDDKLENSCMMTLTMSNYPSSDMKEEIKEGLLGRTDFTFSEKNINGNNWSIGYIDDGYKQFHYATNNGGKLYSLGYNDFSIGDKCTEALKIIENSLKFK